MNVTTRVPRLLVKCVMPPGNGMLNVNKRIHAVTFTPLFTSVDFGGAGKSAAKKAQWYLMAANQPGAEMNAWDMCHHLVTVGFGMGGVNAAAYAEPDLEQQWTVASPAQHALAATRGCEMALPDMRLPYESDYYWFRDDKHSQLGAAGGAIGQPGDRVRIAHCDTGYDPNHKSLPRYLRTDLQRNFVDSGNPNDATDQTTGMFSNLGHGTGTLGILAGAAVDGRALGGAPNAEVIPIRVANSVVLFYNSSIAKAFDYVHSLFQDPKRRVHAITMSMGGIASQAWCDAVNALYDLGVFVVTAAGNNFGNAPTRHIVYPARFNRVVAACGVMADGQPYADLKPISIMAGNYGPAKKMDTALAAYTPNIPWAKLGCSEVIDFDGAGTSAATPQVAAAAALWIQKNKAAWEKYDEGWMRVEAVRKALFDSARFSADAKEKLGLGIVQAQDALEQPPAAAVALRKQPEDSVLFPILRVLTGLGIGAQLDVRQRMLELEALQISQRSPDLEAILEGIEELDAITSSDRRQIIELLHDAPGASAELRKYIGGKVKPVLVRAPQLSSSSAQVKHAMDPPMPPPSVRRLRVYAFDPMLSYKPDFVHLNETTLEIEWADVLPGPVGEYLEVIDVDPATGCCYAPVDLNHPTVLALSGLTPSEADPRFHQQMVYAVAMKTIQHFEYALGRRALWAPYIFRYEENGETRVDSEYTARLRIYPHALREANAYYSPEKKALLFGYFLATESDVGENLPGGTVFTCLSHDVVAHETTHALLDGLHRYFGEATNEDMLAFHEALADIVALFQHFTVPEALRDQIARTRGDLGKQNLLGELAVQFGQAIGNRGALRSAIATYDDVKGEWVRTKPTSDDYRNATEAHDRGAVLVAAIFDAFLDVYGRRSLDLIRLATGGTGVLPEGAISHDLVNRLADEASKTAEHILNICIRALDYCPPVDINFGDYLRALITADLDLVPQDKWGYRTALIQGFRRRGIYPANVRTLAPDSLRWENPQIPLDFKPIVAKLRLGWDLHIDRREAHGVSKLNAVCMKSWLEAQPTSITDALGIYKKGVQTPAGIVEPGVLRPFEVHSVRPMRRIGPDGQQRTDLEVEITQSWLPKSGGKFRGGCTLVVDLETQKVRYAVRKRVGLHTRIEAQKGFLEALADGHLGANYVGASANMREPFAMMHRQF